MNWKRLLQVAVCLVLVCCLVVGVSPISAKATEVIALDVLLASLTDDACVGLLVFAGLLSSGMIIETPDVGALEDAGEAVREYVVENMYIPGSGSPEDPDDDDLTEEEVIAKAKEEAASWGGKVREQVGKAKPWGTADHIILNVGAFMMGAATDFIVDCIQQGYFEREVETPVASGWTYYGDTLLPTAPTYADCPYIICFTDGNKYFFRNSSSPLRLKPSNNYLYAVKSCSVCKDFIPVSYVDSWDASKRYSHSDLSSVSSGNVVDYYCVQILWSNYDVYSYTDGSLVHSADSDPSTTTTTTESIAPIATVGPIVDGIIAGGLTAADIPIPETVDLYSIFQGVETGGLEAVVGNMKSSAAGLASGAISLSDFQQSITYVEDSPGDDTQDPTEDPSPTEGDDSGTEDGDQDIKDGPFSSYSVLDFLSALGDLLQDIADGNFLGVKNFFEPFLSGIREDLSGLSSITESGFQDVIENGQSIIDSMQDIIENNQIQNELNQEIQQEQNNIIEQGFASVSAAVAGGLASAFVPEDGFIEGKVNDLCDEYSFAGSIAATAKDLKSFLTNLGSVPPVIRINLGASSGKYHYGSNMVLIDFSFYEPYKAQMDVILSAFLWLWFCWRVILTLPGIISGASGAVGSFSDASGVGKRGYVELSDSLKGNPVSASHFVPEMDRKHGGRKT